MQSPILFSIDQNCHSLWDVIPKLDALSAHGHAVTHFVEDVDTAFTAIGAGSDDETLRLAPERYHRSGGADWGAAVFYSEFLGRLPVEIRDWEPYTGLKTKALARELGRSVDDLYDEFSPSDNWQLIGPSYVGDRGRHRVVGDLTVAETAPFLREILQRARADTLAAFPDPPCRRRAERWFAEEQQLLERLLIECDGGRLVDVYQGWLRERFGGRVGVDLTSNLLATGADPERTAVLEAFTRDYSQAAGLYNEAIDEAGVELRPLRIRDGELPFFAVGRRDGRWMRSAVHLDGDAIRIDDRAFALEADRRLPIRPLRDAGIVGLAGKAILLVTQVRVGAGGAPLAVPHRGSLYLPAAHLLAQKLAAAGLLPGEGKLAPIVRVRMGLLDRLRSLDAALRLPPHLAKAFGTEEISARQFGESWAAVARRAATRLEGFREELARQTWQRAAFAGLYWEIDHYDLQRRQLAEEDPKAPEIREVWKQIKLRHQQILAGTVRQIATDWQVRELDYWDSRGALLPWCVALGGQEFYNRLIQEARIYDETSPAT